ncbi:hypothetical protein [Corallococcus macrosporus]|uniref:DUF3325 domain-containing protein n=1 Tax=Myxococcus fulvus (strain ATCC BAA-855 / HW-1) TaxID=483219 RepID=F8CH53_MYXFH|nr:hypothetical protein [Corallococcus macrosporus]AEI64970.1 hypothetical protein LILAB_15335 [Corallococcus macrosporus]
MAVSTLLILLGIAVLLSVTARAPQSVLTRHRGWARGVGAVACLVGVAVGVKAQGPGVGLTTATVVAMLATPVLALCGPLWPRATRWAVPLSAVGLVLAWVGTR